ncbi:2,3-bisphosphoglycerate-dependent phosphoglycerate mutase [Liquorilactobacillus aquaticus DSM 21051]|uniref:2,3-bisphosphoglycerate-dependent phosphoglycerate mutase n=1 Tax=Liquorilactobacillus aquaticus DSM 21051 TaxID=1423725 RepID=A0A0R2D620_9LACO|nr:2,3-diphosphoglycerate-dependent phosphoglycerate mutase [Liquorilactobacillus aquaticus]KRM95931.1 2,3-bisphosphoglycerate-dependent phosphoglycerate mutase [Liquorilactobacillus aquaticus DSM 21051]
MVKLVLLRHGQSQANQTNTYTGWTDSLLTEEGAKEAKKAGELLKKEKIFFSTVHTSFLVRAIKTANIVLSTISQTAVPIRKNWRLNERHYGALRGINKDLSRQIYGKHQVALWRRSYDAIPPLMDHPDYDRRYDRYSNDILPLGESLKMASERIIPYWLDNIAPQLLHGENQLVVAHGSTLRALIKYIEEISDEKIDGVEVENAVPIVYELDHKLRVTSKRTL